ncbi:hypothetical protein [Synechococcus sp. CCAP 1479/9]|uniref:hypothetical protein n=1 Tax=Synechococcus sp. CCAP 1479/9 TaxID=1221593 RepID=UPI001C215852|nr:hypothetical protein [Synechococcus sp. CCAP 1479/9]
MARQYHQPGPGRPGPLSRNSSGDPVAPTVQLWVSTAPAVEPLPSSPAPRSATSPAALQRPS